MNIIAGPGPAGIALDFARERLGPRWFVPAIAVGKSGPRRAPHFVFLPMRQVTFDVYGHLFPQSREEAADKLQKAMFASPRSGSGSSLVANTENPITDQPRHNSREDR